MQVAGDPVRPDLEPDVLVIVRSAADGIAPPARDLDQAELPPLDLELGWRTMWPSSSASRVAV